MYLVTTFQCFTPVHQYKSVKRRETFELSDESANTNAITKLELVYQRPPITPYSRPFLTNYDWITYMFYILFQIVSDQ